MIATFNGGATYRGATSAPATVTVGKAETKVTVTPLNSPTKTGELSKLRIELRPTVGNAEISGTVKVTDKFIIERYSHVMHIVSNVEGKLKKDMDGVDAFFAGFPAGTVSGAPKVRAMQIIDELEVNRRGFYGGGVGYFSGAGELDTCIALRTSLVKDGKLYAQAGAGIVADSKPESEYEETVNKAKALITAAEEALKRAAPKSQAQPQKRPAAKKISARRR